MTREDLDNQLIEHAERQTKALESIALATTLLATLAVLGVLAALIVAVRGA